MHYCKEINPMQTRKIDRDGFLSDLLASTRAMLIEDEYAILPTEIVEILAIECLFGDLFVQYTAVGDNGYLYDYSRGIDTLGRSYVDWVETYDPEGYPKRFTR